jgi:hypothetical protein
MERKTFTSQDDGWCFRSPSGMRQRGRTTNHPQGNSPFRFFFGEGPIETGTSTRCKTTGKQQVLPLTSNHGSSVSPRCPRPRLLRCYFCCSFTWWPRREGRPGVPIMRCVDSCIMMPHSGTQWYYHAGGPGTINSVDISPDPPVASEDLTVVVNAYTPVPIEVSRPSYGEYCWLNAGFRTILTSRSPSSAVMLSFRLRPSEFATRMSLLALHVRRTHLGPIIRASCPVQPGSYYSFSYSVRMPELVYHREFANFLPARL